MQQPPVTAEIQNTVLLSFCCYHKTFFFIWLLCIYCPTCLRFGELLADVVPCTNFLYLLIQCYTALNYSTSFASTQYTAFSVLHVECFHYYTVQILPMHVTFTPRQSKPCSLAFFALCVGEENLADKEWTAVWEAGFVNKGGPCKNAKKVSDANIRYIPLLFLAVMYSADRNWLCSVGHYVVYCVNVLLCACYCVNVDVKLGSRINQRCLYCSVWVIHLMKLRQLSVALEVRQQPITATLKLSVKSVDVVYKLPASLGLLVTCS